MKTKHAIRCQCERQETKVIDSRPTEKYGAHARRRVECLTCGQRWTTFELDEAALLELQAPRVHTLIGHVKRFLTLIESHAIEEEAQWTTPNEP